MKHRKERHQKLFSEKFAKNITKVHSEMSDDVRDLIQTIYDKYEFYRTHRDLEDHKILELVVKEEGFYAGVFYLNPTDDKAMSIINFNPEYGCESLAKINQDNETTHRLYKNNEFMKCYVVQYDGKNALAVTTYNDSFNPIIYSVFDAEVLGLENGVIKTLF